MKYYYDLQAWLPRNVVVVNKKAFESLSPSIQAAILEAAKTAEIRGWKMSKDVNQKSMDALAAHGMKIITPTESLKSEFKKIGAVLLQDWNARAGAEGKEIVAEYEKSN